MPATQSEEQLPTAETGDSLTYPAKVSASPPNAVKLTLECRDLSSLTAIIGVLDDV